MPIKITESTKQINGRNSSKISSVASGGKYLDNRDKINNPRKKNKNFTSLQLGLTSQSRNYA